MNVTSAANASLTVGESAQVVEVQASEVAVNTEQATVQGVLTSEQIENLPINGRNFLDLAQLEPGVQIQDGGTFDPTKNGVLFCFVRRPLWSYGSYRGGRDRHQR